jgi:hypothetical protein
VGVGWLCWKNGGVLFSFVQGKKLPADPIPTGQLDWIYPGTTYIYSMMMEISIPLYIQQFNPTVAVPVPFQYLEYSVLELLALVLKGTCVLKFLENQKFCQQGFPNPTPES